jgi:ABC-type glycerol-3-phosphate transport system permease component
MLSLPSVRVTVPSLMLSMTIRAVADFAFVRFIREMRALVLIAIQTLLLM